LLFGCVFKPCEWYERLRALRAPPRRWRVSRGRGEATVVNSLFMIEQEECGQTILRGMSLRLRHTHQYQHR